MKETSPHSLGPEFQLTRVIRSKIGEVYFYNKNIAIVEVNEGVNLSYAIGFSLLVQGLKILGNKKWVYISNRVNSYSVVPTDYNYLDKIPTLIALSIVNNSDSKRFTIPIESTFCKKPFKDFNDLKEAAYWAKEKLEEANSSKGRKQFLL